MIPIPDGRYYLGIPGTDSQKGEAVFELVIKNRKVNDVLSINKKGEFFHLFFVSTCNFLLKNNDCCLKDDSDKYPNCKYWLVSN